MLAVAAAALATAFAQGDAPGQQQGVNPSAEQRAAALAAADAPSVASAARKPEWVGGRDAAAALAGMSSRAKAALRRQMRGRTIDQILSLIHISEPTRQP